MHCSPLIDIRKTQNVESAKLTAKFAPARGKNIPGVFPTGPVDGRPTYVNTGAVKYPVQNLSLPVREQRPSPQLWNQSPDELVNFDGLLTGRGWVEQSEIAHQASPSDAANFDTNMSDNTSEGRKSSGHTPSTNHSSSNTSYSSPHEENIDSIGPSSSHRRSHDSAGLTPAGSTPGMFSFSSIDEVQYPVQASPRLQDNAGLSDSQLWQLGSPGGMQNGLTSSSPSSDVAWAQLLDGVLWDDSQAGIINNTVQWTGQQGPVA